VLHSIGATV